MFSRKTVLLNIMLCFCERKWVKISAVLSFLNFLFFMAIEGVCIQKAWEKNTEGSDQACAYT